MTRLIACLFLLVGAIPSIAAERVGDQLTVNQWVQLSEQSGLQGRFVVTEPSGAVRAISDSVVKLIDADGKVFRAATNDAGEFTIKDLETGVYSLSAQGNGLYACFAMHLYDNKQAGSSLLPNSVEVVAARINPQTVKLAKMRYLPARIQQASRSLAGVRLNELAGTVRQGNKLRILQTEGGMKGRILLAGAIGAELEGASDTNLFIFDEGFELARTVTDGKGNFNLSGVPAGSYTAIAIGPGGLGITGFELISPLSGLGQVDADQAEATLVAQDSAMVNSASETFVLQVAPQPSDGDDDGGGEVIIEEEVIVDEGFADGFGTPAGGGGPSGGGGGGGGFGGGGGLIAAGAIAAAAVAAGVSGDDGDIIIAPPPASPAIP